MMKPNAALRRVPFALGWVLIAAGCAEDAPAGPAETAVDAVPEVAAVEVSLGFGPMSVPAGVERTQCVTMRLGNTAQMRVGSIRNELIGSSHHLIVYRVSDTEERREPYDCEPFADTLSAKNGAPLMITQKHDELLQLPEGLAFVLEPNQMIRLEVHYYNASDRPSMIETRSTFTPLRDSAFKHAVGFLFAGNIDVLLPPGQATQVSSFIEVPFELYDKHFFGFTGHTHALGTNVVLEMGGRKGEMQPVYEVADFTWSEPPTQYHDPARTMPSDGRFRLTCDYVNDTDRQVRFGESAHDEMCFFWGYYYPSAGSHVCFRSNRAGIDINQCCPGGPFCG